MLLHYLKITFRKLGKNIIFSSINISGLIIAYASAFLIFLFVLNELSTDRFYKNSNDIYRVIVETNLRDQKVSINASSHLLAKTIPGIFPEIKSVSQMYSYNHFEGGQYVKQGTEDIEALNFYVVNQGFFDIFSYELIYGDQKNLMKDINSLVITESMAKKHFPNEKNPIGKILNIEDAKGIRAHIITGVIKDFPANSTLQANYLGHYDLTEEFLQPRGWGMSATTTFIMFRPGTDVNLFTEKLNKFAQDHHAEENYTYTLQNVNDVYFHSGHLYLYKFPIGNYGLIITYLIIGLLILIIVSINYIIISTAKSSERIVEIGIRKVIGANRRNLFRQIITESILFSFLAFPLAIILSEFSLPFFNHLIGKELNLNYLSNWPYIAGIFLITVFIGIISGLYIAVYISSFSPEQIFKKQFVKHKSKINLWKILITTQISIFVGLFIFSSIIFLQINYASNKKIGFNANNIILVIPPTDHNLFSCKAFVDEVRKSPHIINVSEVSSGLYSSLNSNEQFVIDENPTNKIEIKMQTADYDYLSTLEVDLLAGRKFDRSYGTDSMNIIINQTAAKLFNIDDLNNHTLTSTRNGEKYKVIGIINDFHYPSIHSKIQPVGVMLKRKNRMVTQVMVKANPAYMAETIDFLEKTWNEYRPYGKFKYTFLQNEISKQYTNDQNFSNTIKTLAFLTIILAGFGIFGFSFYNAKRKHKEIGIRKVYGASIAQILKMMSKELAWLILIANAIAWPFAYIISENWLNKYAYHINISVWIFLLALATTVFIVLITSITTAYIAANKNPVDSLKYE